MSLRWIRAILMICVVAAAYSAPLHAQQDPPRTRNPHGAIEIPCQNCHAADSWKPIRAFPDFDHSQTKYPLLGRHQAVTCTGCHVQIEFANVGATCASCHADIHRRQFGASCETCHTVQGWNVQVEAVRRHANRFPLVGAHAAANCESCHRGAASGTFTGLSTACISCHATDYERSSTVDHRAANFSVNCETCHTLTQWRGAKFNHDTATRFPLSGAHAAVQCGSCHVGGRFQGTPSNCAGCHTPDYDRTTNPNHRASGFQLLCETCHTNVTWKNASFDHNLARFSLTGAHAAVQCASCHVNNRFTGTSADCVSCHRNDFTAATRPSHTGFSTACASCHTTTKWSGAQFNHSLTRFPLTGAHVATACASCHVGNVFAGTPQTCNSCHSAQFAATTAPNHVASGFSRECATCHATTQWRGAQFNHSLTRFPLTGAHTATACASCHVGNRFAGTPQNCMGCHAANYNAAVNPNHAAAGFPQDCQTCHTTTQWRGSTFNHSTSTRFPLTGSHATVSCVGCHAGNRFAGTPQDCASCHGTLFDRTTSPNHVAAGFPRDCAVCHSTTRWIGASFDHSRTRFPLTGAHVSATCARCHVGGQYTGLNTACASCHLTLYNATTTPNHAAAGFPQDCQTCHTTTQWRGATFSHNSTRFPLTGAHVQVQCANCHIGGRYSGTPMDCNSCHSQVFNSVTNPNHVAAGFPRTCQNCHTTTTWTGATFTHRFPIYSGAHQGKWSAVCATCHTSASSYAVFNCLTCHEHRRSEMDSKHRNRQGYVYDSLTCYGCHPNGRK